jgi:5-carboxymethyl-2-hydroxymuconate isomerase
MGSQERESQEIEGYAAFIHAVLDAGGGFTENSKLRLTASFYGVLRYHPDQHAKWVLNVSQIRDLELKQNIGGGEKDPAPTVK